MKNILLFTACIFYCLSLSAQEKNRSHNYNYHYSNHTNHKTNHHSDQDKIEKEFKISHSGGNIILTGIGDLEIESYNGSEVIFKTKVDAPSTNDHDRAKGLKALNANGFTDNTGLGYSADVENGNLVISSLNNIHCDCEPLQLKIPYGIGIVIEETSYAGDDIYIKNVKDPIDISVNHQSIVLENVTGPMAVKTLYGHIVANFEKLSQEGTISLVAYHDFVDVSIPASAKANLNLKTLHGEIYSDLDIDINRDNAAKGNGVNQKTITGKINGGGVAMTLNSQYNEVYLRKK